MSSPALLSLTAFHTPWEQLQAPKLKTPQLVAVHLIIMILAVFRAGIKSFIFME